MAKSDEIKLSAVERARAGTPSVREIEDVARWLYDNGNAFEVRYDGSAETIRAVRLHEHATSIAKCAALERELALTQEALAEQAEQTGELLTTIVRNATSQQQLRIAELEARNAELEQRFAAAIEILEIGPEGECGGAGADTVIERAHAVLCGEPDPYDTEDDGDPTDVDGNPKQYASTEGDTNV